MDVNVKVSIITSTYNSENEIFDTYKSIKNQTFSDWEWIVTDDCSSDNTCKILDEIAKNDERVQFTILPLNSGAAVARNTSISFAKGEFLAFIDSDDLWLPDKLYLQLKFMSDNIDFSFTAYELIDEDGNRMNKIVDQSQSGQFSYKDMLKKKATLGCSTVMLRLNAFDNISMPLLRTGQDYATWLRLLKTGTNAFLLNTALTQYRIRPNSISRNKLKKANRQWEIYRDIENLSLINSLTCFLFYAWRAVFRK